MANITKLSLTFLALILITSLASTQARNIKVTSNNNEPLKPQTFPGFPGYTATGSTLGVPQFRLPSMGGGSSLGGLGGFPAMGGMGGFGGSSLPGFPGMPGMPGRGAANTVEKKP